MTDYALFLGSFHPVLVHVPIGVLVAAFALQLLSLVPRFRSLAGAVGWLYGMAAAGGILAVATGWALAGPTGAHWDTHRWFGLGALALGLATTFYTLRHSGHSLTGLGLGLLTVGITGWAGHLGGSITHGEGHFIQYAPTALQPSVGKNIPVLIRDPDSVLVYREFIQPLLDEHCTACHRADLRHGQLRLDSYAALLTGGKEGDAITSGTKGELWKRISLPPAHPRFMPTRGTPLSYDQLSIVRSWLAAERDSLLSVNDWAPDEPTLAAVERAYRLNVRPLPYVDRARPAPVDLNSLPRGWDVQLLSSEHTTLVVRVVEPDASPEALTAIASNITHLDLRNLRPYDDLLSDLPLMPHLTKLNLKGLPVTDAPLSTLARYPHLEMLNLTGTLVTDGGLTELDKLPAIRQLYVYGTTVSSEGLTAFREAHPEIEMPGRFAFSVAE